MSENSIEFSLSNSEQRDSWLNSGHQTLDADIKRWRRLKIIPQGNVEMVLLGIRYTTVNQFVT